MTTLVRQNIYGAWLDGDATVTEALRALCNDYEELDDTYKQFEGMREQTRQQISHVVSKMDGEQAEVEGFGVLRITPPSVVKGYDKAKIQELINDLIADHPDIAARLAACETKTMRAGGLRIEREKAAR